ncbi:hypothetical protein CHS0354_031153 [Potamilus streckersoni]|uniref:Uncharacterized protein n=1 Tax=Potamilus streckersoni TaxID=2493646 RepID=A0AAE0TMU0_9BIVA|nr:hypothetical protein CHS0354_031153 [Potamilus streckersoni]
MKGSGVLGIFIATGLLLHDFRVFGSLVPNITKPDIKPGTTLNNTTERWITNVTSSSSGVVVDVSDDSTSSEEKESQSDESNNDTLEVKHVKDKKQ